MNPSEPILLALSEHEERHFEDGEHKTRSLTNVRGRDVYVVHSLYADPVHSVNDKLCRLLFFIGALKDASATSVTAVVPYLAYARKDQKSKTRDPVTMDVHNLAAYQSAFRCHTEHMQANGLFVRHFLPLVRGQQVVVVAPDAGGIKRSERFRQSLSHSLCQPVAHAFAEKHRSEGVLSGSLLEGNAAQVLSDAALAGIVVTDSVPPFRLENSALQKQLVVLPSADLFAEAVAGIHGNTSITQLLQT